MAGKVRRMGSDRGPDRLTLFLSSSDCSDTHPSNRSSDFTVDLSKPLTLEGDWEIAVLELGMGGPGTGNVNTTVCCSLCEESPVYGGARQILRQVVFRKNKMTSVVYSYPCFVPVKKEPSIQRVRVYINNVAGGRASLGSKHSSCTLQLRRLR